MARVELSDGWLTSGSVSGIQTAANRFFLLQRMKVIGEQAGEIHLRQGWWLGRVVGPLAPAAWLAKKAVVKLAQTKDGVTVRVHIEEDTSTSGLSARQKEKYSHYFKWWTEQLRLALA